MEQKSMTRSFELSSLRKCAVMVAAIGKVVEMVVLSDGVEVDVAAAAAVVPQCQDAISARIRITLLKTAQILMGRLVRAIFAGARAIA